MSDVVWAAAIAGAVGVAGNITTYVVSRQQAKTAIASAKGQSEVELEKVRAENERLREEHREAERQNRQGTYHRFLAALDRFDMMATGNTPATDAHFSELLGEYNQLYGAIRLFGAEPVRTALNPVVRLFVEVGAAMGDAEGETSAARFAEAYNPRRETIIEATAALTDAMREDITRNVLSPA